MIATSVSASTQQPILYGPSSLVVSGLEAATNDAKAAQALRALVEEAVDFGWQGDLWSCAVAQSLVTSENPFSLACERRGATRESLWRIALRDMALYQRFFTCSLPSLFDLVRDFSQTGCRAPRAEVGLRIQRLSQELLDAASAKDPERMLELLTDFYETHGVGALGLGELFRICETHDGLNIVSVKGRLPVALSDLVGYEQQKGLLCKNTEAFLSGRPANNVLLYGDAGTGKSTSVQALASEYADRGLRMIELYKHQFSLIPELFSQIKGRNYRFVLLLDDLSFEENETQYKQLKAVLEGGGEATPENVLVYATSNRRHLVRETWSDRTDLEHAGDVHRSDTMEEKLSLAGRFGLQIYYPNPSFEEYHAIVRELAQRQGALEVLSDEELRARAATWQVRRGNRSGRAAEQFVSDLMAELPAKAPVSKMTTHTTESSPC